MQDTKPPSKSGRTKRSGTRRTQGTAARGAGAAKGASPRPGRAPGRKRAAKPAAPPRCSLPPVCTLEQAADLRSELLGLLPASEPVVLDAAALERVDSAGLQVLAAFVASRVRDGREVVWQQQEGVLADAVRTLGLEGVMNMTDCRG